MSAKLDILRSIARRVKITKEKSVPANTVQDEILLSDALFKEELLQLEKRNLIEINTIHSNWYRNFAEACPTLFLKLTNAGLLQVKNNPH